MLQQSVPLPSWKTALRITLELRAKKLTKRCLNWQFHCGRSEHDPGTTERVPKPSAGQASPNIIRDTFCPAKCTISCICYLSKTHFVREFLQIATVEDMKTKLSCEISFKFQQLKMWKRSFRARLLWNSNRPFKLSIIQTFKLSDIQTFRHSISQTLKLSDIQIFRRSNFQTVKLSDNKSTTF